MNYRWSETSVSSLNASDQEVMAAKISTEALSRIELNLIAYHLQGYINERRIIRSKTPIRRTIS